MTQQHLNLFCQGWAHHHMRSEGNKTPQQLWIRGLQDTTNTNNAAITGLDVSWSCALISSYKMYMKLYVCNIQAEWDDYGIDWEGPIQLADETAVTVDELVDVLNDSQKERLGDLLSPLTTNVYCKEEMIAQYAVAKTFINQYGTEP